MGSMDTAATESGSDSVQCSIAAPAATTTTASDESSSGVTGARRSKSVRGSSRAMDDATEWSI